MAVMAVHWILASLCASAFLVTVRCQEAKIVEEIFTEVKRKGDTGYLNCTVSRQQSNKVYWAQPLGPGNENYISSDTQILAKNLVINGKFKYEVIRRFRGNDKTTYTLVVNRLREEDSGRYKCFVYELGRPPVNWPSKFGNLTVQVPPVVMASQTTNALEVNQGANVSLKCNATGNPMPNITWIRASGEDLRKQLTHRGHFLNITNITKDDQGIYRCVADNNVIPFATYDFKLVVYFKPEVKAVQNTVGQAANKRIGATLECRISGYPDPDLSWYKKTKRGKVLLKDDEDYDIFQSLLHGTELQLNDVFFSLKIHNLQANDFGIYYCEGKNTLGVTSAEVELYETALCQGPACPRAGGLTGDGTRVQTSGISLIICLYVFTSIIGVLV